MDSIFNEGFFSKTLRDNSSFYFVTDDHSFFRVAAQFFEENGIAVKLSVSSDTDEVLTCLDSMRPSFTFIRKSEDAGSLELSLSIKRALPQTHCVVYLDHRNFKLDYLMNFNISAYLSSSDHSLMELIRCVQMLAGGYRYIGANVRNALANMEQFTLENSFDGLGLTRQETIILNLLVRGLSSKEITEKLFISHNTLNNHKTKIKSKLNLVSNRDIVFFAMRNRHMLNAIKIDNPDIKTR